MIDIVGTTVCFIIISLILTILIGIYDWKKKKKLTEKFGVMCIIFIAGTVILVAVLGHLYFVAIGMPYDYVALRDSVDEVKSLLLQYVNQSEKSGTMIDIDEGLESLGYKVKLPEMIEKANQKKADINAWLRNPFMPFQNELRAGLPVDW